MKVLLDGKYFGEWSESLESLAVFSGVDVSRLAFDPDQLRASVAEKIAARRYQAEVSGIVFDGHRIATDRDSQDKLKAERAAVQDGLRRDGSGWKCLNISTGELEFRPTTNAEIIMLSAAAYTYVSDCFAREEVLLGLLSAGSFTDDMLDADWPSGIVGEVA